MRNDDVELLGKLAAIRDGAALRDASGRLLGYREGKELRDASGRLVGYWDGNDLRDAAGVLRYYKTRGGSNTEIRDALGVLRYYRHDSEKETRHTSGVLAGYEDTNKEGW